MDRDAQLMLDLAQGDRSAFERIISAHKQRVMNIAYRFLQNSSDAEDVTQEVFIRTYSSLRSYNPQFKFSTWLYRIASNFIIDHWRKKKIDVFSLDHQKKLDRDLPPIQVPADEESIVTKFETSQLRDRIERTLERIPSSLREVFVWRHINELSYEEIAEIKGLPTGTIKNRVFQAKELIRNLLEEMP